MKLQKACRSQVTSEKKISMKLVIKLTYKILVTQFTETRQCNCYFDIFQY